MKCTSLLEPYYSGDEDSLNKLLEEYLPWIHTQVRRRLGPFLRQKEQSSDYVQEAMFQFLRDSPKLQISDGKQFRALMARIVENVLRDRNDWFRAQRRAIASERPLPSDTVLNLDPPQGEARASPSQVALQHEREAWVRLGLDLLEQEQRRIILLRDFEGLTFGEIGKALDISYDAARLRYNRAFEVLTEKVWVLRYGRLEDAL